jgi:AAA domain
MHVLEQAIAAVHPTLVVLDPIQSYVGDINMHKSNETRPLLTALRLVAERSGCAIVAIRHPAKPGQHAVKAMHRGLGSIDFVAAARSGLFVEQHPTDPHKVFMAQYKSSVGPLGRTQVFSKQHGQFEWCGITRLTAEAIAGGSTLLEAACWLEEQLQTKSPWPAEEIKSTAYNEEIAAATLQRAKLLLGILSYKDGNAWFWRFPEEAPPTPPAPTTPMTS